jgi:large repetitive protein
VRRQLRFVKFGWTSSSLCSLVLLVVSCGPCLGQGAKITSEFESPEEHERDRVIERDQWFMRGRIAPPGKAAALRLRAHQQKIQLRSRITTKKTVQTSGVAAAVSGTAWTPLGPSPLLSAANTSSHIGGDQDYGPVSGRATSVAIDQNDATGNTVFIGGAFGGLWKSTNAAAADPTTVVWTPLIDDQATLAVGAIALKPDNSNVILVGTGEANSSGDSYYGLGILRSADGGVTWNLIPSSSDGHSLRGVAFSKIAFSTANPSLVVAATAGSFVGVNEGLESPINVNRGIYVSTNAGVTWTYAIIKDGANTIDPGSVSSVIYNAAAGKFFATVRRHGYYSSTDGANWTRLTTQPGAALTTVACPASPFSSNCPIYRGEFAVVPGRNEMYTWFVDFPLSATTEVDKGMFRSADGGATWVALSRTGITVCGEVDGCGVSQGAYNLELAAVPNGAVTDLYAGAINIYKCTLNSGATNCSNPSPSLTSWMNLTHVYGCTPVGSSSHVHPDQHGVDFKVVSGKALMYFANDGGIYRALDGYLGLNSGQCIASVNKFDSLNGTLGSMTQYVSFSQHPTDPNTLLGGTQDNGSPAVGSGTLQWVTVNGGDGGFNEINPSNPTEWFTANTDVSIQRCTSGINCTGPLFPIVVSNNTLGTDAGPFYTPYILDPQLTSRLIVGTCRVWRGLSTGGTFKVLSNNFDTNNATVCTGNETNLVRSLAAGGPTDASGSTVIWTTTDATGPLVTAPAGGEVQVSTNAGAATPTFTNVTGSINPQHYPISSVAVDATDATGQTAYVGLMGFGGSHVFKTVNAGQTWTDFTANLPDAPVNSIVVDSAAATVYVGTDVGVFASSTSGASWLEIGPSSGTGMLPNVAVTKVRIFSSGSQKILRASTYGRGVWQFVLQASPDFSIAVPTATQTAFVGQSATFTGTLTALSGFGSQVTLSCIAGTTAAPPTCTPSPTSVTPTSGGVAFSLTASSNSANDYVFNVRGVGSDAGTTTHTTPLTLHVVDFALGALSSSAVSVNRGLTSSPVTFQVSASGAFSGTVTLACNNLPAGATCNFSPSASVQPVSGSPVSVSLAISTTSATPTGTASVSVAASATGAPAAKTRALSLTVTANPDFGIVITNSPQAAASGQTATFTGTLTAVNAYASTVNLSCTTNAPTPCTITPQSLTPTPTGASFTIVAGATNAGSVTFTIQAVGTDASTTTHTTTATLNVAEDFSISTASNIQSVAAGASASYTLDFAPLGSATFSNNVTYACSGLPNLAACSFTPSQIIAGSGATPVNLSISTRAPIAKMNLHSSIFYALWLALPLFGFLITMASRKGKRKASLLGMTCGILLIMISCGGGGGGGGGGGQPGTPPGTYNVTVTASSGALTHAQTLTLTVH